MARLAVRCVLIPRWVRPTKVADRWKLRPVDFHMRVDTEVRCLLLAERFAKEPGDLELAKPYRGPIDPVRIDADRTLSC
jgi:hypothetical protein